MQRIHEISRKNKNYEDKPKNACKTIAKLEISNDILFLMSLTYPNISRVLPKSQKRLVPKSMHLKIDSQTAFESSLKLHPAIKHLHLKNINVVHFRQLNLTALETLVLENVNRFDTDDSIRIEVFRLSLKNLHLSYFEFSVLMKIFSPRSLILEKITFKNTSDLLVSRVVNLISALDLLELICCSCFVNFEQFEYLILKKKLKKFLYKDNIKLFSYSSFAGGLSYLTLGGVSLMKYDSLVEDADILYILPYQQCSAIPDRIHKMIKHLVIHDFDLSTDFLRKFRSLKSIVLTKCHFIGFSFYEFIDMNPGLRYFCSRNSELPLDCISHMKKKLNNCLVKLNQGNEFYISNIM